MSSDWFLAENWLGGFPRQTDDGIINTVTPNSTVLTSPDAQANNLVIGQNGPGILTIQNIGALATSSGAVGNLSGSLGTVTVTGAGASWSTASNIVVGGLGTGTLTIQDDGLMSSGSGSVGQSAGSTGTVTVTGPGSTWINGTSGGLNIGSFGTGTLTVANGGKVIDIVPGPVANIGNDAGSLGTVTVTGAGSTWSNSSGLNIGNLGTGTLTIADSGVVSAVINGPIVIAANAGSIGTLNIGAGAGNPAAAPGTLAALSLEFGAGTGTINFNHTSDDYVFAPAISGNGTVKVLAGTTILTANNSYTGSTTITAGTLQLGNGGTSGSIVGNIVDNGTLAFNHSDTVSFPGVISGSGGLTQAGSGTLSLTGANTYTGPTNINAGTLAIGGRGSIGASSGVNLTAAGSAFDISAGGNQTIGDLSGVAGSAVTLGGNTLTASTANSSTFAGTISGGIGALTKQGTGTLTLTGANTYGGGTNLNGGTLAVGNNTALGTGTLVMAGGTTLQAAANGLSLGNAVSLTGADTVDTQANTLTLGNTISGAGALNKIGPGTLSLTGANSYSGGTSLNAGTLAVGNNAALGTGALGMAAGTTLQFAAANLSLANTISMTGDPTFDTMGNSATVNGVISGAGATLEKTGSGTLTLTAVNTYTGPTNVNAGTLAIGGGGSIAASSGINVTAAGSAFNISAGGNQTIGDLSGVAASAVTLGGNTLTAGTANSSTFAGTISGGGGALTKQGMGTLSLSGANAYTGGTNLNAGTLAVGNNTALGTGALVMAGGTTLQAAANGLSIGNAVSLNGTGTVDTQANALTLGNTVSGGGGLNKIGPGTLSLTGANTYTGGTNLNAGTLAVGNNTALGTGALVMAGGTTLQAAANGLSIGNAVSLTGTGTVDTQANALTLGNTVSGGGGLNKISPGTLSLTGANTYTGGTNLNAGTLAVGNNTALGTGALVMAGGTSLQAAANGLSIGNAVSLTGTGTVDAQANALTLGNTVSGGGGLNKIGPGTLSLTGANSYGGGTSLNAGTLAVGNNSALGTGTLAMAAGTTLQFAAANLSLANMISMTGDPTFDTMGNNATVSGVISGAGATLEKNGGGTLTLVAVNTYTGPTNISAGTLAIGGGGSIGASSGVNLTAAGSAFDISGGGNQTIGDLSGVAGSAVTLGGNTLTAGTANSSTFAGAISGGTGALTKQGTGTLSLTGANTYGGGTSLNAGTLAVGNNTALGTGALAMAGGTTLQAAANGLSLGNAVSLNGAGTVDTQANALTLGNTVSGGGGLTKIGSGTLSLSGANTYAGGTSLNAGTLAVGNNTALGTGALAMASGTTLQAAINGLNLGNAVSLSGTGTVDTQANALTLGNIVSGTGALNKTGSGTLTLTGANSYSGGTTISAGTLQLGGGGVSGSIIGDVTDNGVLAFNRSDTVTSPGVISGSGSVSQIGSGRTVLTANNSYGGATTVLAGALFVNGDQSAATGATNVAGGATLGGTGIIGGNVGVANGGTLAPGGMGVGRGTLTINGSLGLNGGSTLNYGFGQAGAVGGPFNDLTVVKGNLTLAGTLNVALTPGSAFDPGIYRIISYAGTLTDNGLLLGSVPPGTTEVVQTSVAHQVNLANTTGVTLEYWDGAAAANKNNGVLDGGNGTWQNPAGNNNWTNVAGTLNAPWANAGFAIFEAAPGTVTVDNSLGQVVASGMQFAVGGYAITGDPITLVETVAGAGATIVRVGDGTAAGTGMTATIGSVLQGSTQLVKDDLGTLVLTGANTYSGGTTIGAGTLQLGNGGTSGSILGNVADNGTLAFNRSDTVSFPGVISGSGGLAQLGPGTTILIGDNSYTGGTTISAGTLQLGNGGTSGSILGNVADNGTLAFNRSDTVSFPGVISGSGGLAQLGLGTTILIGDNSYTGGTTISAGTLQLGNGGTSGSILGNVADNGTLAFNRSDTVSFPGVISGSGGLAQLGPGITILTGANSYSGGTTIAGGTLQLGNGGTSGSILGNVADNGTLAFNRSDTVSFPGVISGNGGLTQLGLGTTVLIADNSYSGGTTIAAGTLQLGNGGASGSIVGNVVDNGILAFDRSDTVSFPGAISGSGNLAQLGPGTTILTAANSYGGATTVNAGSLRAGAPNTFSPNSAVTISGGGMLNLNGFNQTVSSIANAGLVNLGTGTAPGTVLTATNFRGAGGTFALNTFLGGDGSPSDKLVVNGGSATGNSLLRIINAGGPGVQTVANGIPVVQAINGGSTAAGAFQLGNLVVAGPFEYRLFRGSVDASAPNDWFLRNNFVVPSTPTPPTSIPPNPFPPAPPPEPLPPGVNPIIGPRLATYGVVQPIARQLGLTQLSTMHERIGDTLTAAYPEGEGFSPSAWGRFFGQQIDNRYQAFADPRASGQLLGVQAGLDLWRGSLLPGHRDVLGAYFAYGKGDLDINGLVTNLAATGFELRRTGTLNLNAYSGGGYWTHYGPGGWYLDAVLQGTGYDGTATAQSANLPVTTELSTGGSGFLASLEGGYPIPLQFGPNFILEPQAQIIWQHTSFDPGNDGTGNIALGSTSGTTGRLGLRAQWTIPGENGAIWQPYARTNLWRDWGGAAATNFSSAAVEVPLIEHATRVEFAGGVSFKLDPNLSFYGQAGYQFATDSNISRDGVKGDVGLRFSW